MVKITNFPDSGSRERVALDLASKIAFAEDAIVKDRAYWLNLYYESFAVVCGSRPNS